MPERSRIGLCTSLLAEIFDSNRELLLELQFYNAIGRYRKDHPVLEKLKVNEDLTFDASQMPDDDKAVSAVNALIGAARSIMEIFVGAEEAETKILEPASTFLAAEGIDPQASGLLDSLPALRGLGEAVVEGELGPLSFGIGCIDEGLRNELAAEHGLLLQGMQGIEKDVVLALFAKEGLDAGSVLYVTSTEPPLEVERRLEMLGADVAKAKEEKRLVFVDWYSKNVERVQGVDTVDNWVRCSGDLTNVSVALDIALKTMAEGGAKRAVLDFISPSIINFDFETLYDFTNAVGAKLRSKECMCLAYMNKEMHSKEEASYIKDIFDGVIDMDRYYEGGEVVNDIGILSFSGFFDTDRSIIKIHDRGCWFGSGPDDENKEEFLAKRGVRDRVGAGMTGLDIMTGGGIFKGYSYMIRIPPGTFPLDFINQLSSDILKNDFALSVAVSTPSPAEVIARLHESGHVTTSLMNTAALRIVDWQTQKNQRVMGVDDKGGVLRVSKDIMHLGVAQDMALNQLDGDKEVMAVVETLSYTLREYDLRTVFQYIQALTAKFKKRGISAYFIMEAGTQDRDVMAALGELFDGIIDIVNIGGELAVGISAMKDTNYMGVYKPLTKLRSGLTIEVTETVDFEAPGTRDAATASEEGAEEELDRLRQERELLEKRHRDILEKEKTLNDGLENLKSRIEAFESERKKKDGHRQELASILEVLDDLLEKLPDEHIERFANSPHFARYEKIMDLYLAESEEKKEEKSNE